MPNRYDYLCEVQKSDVDEIEEIQKFNPYHGYHGYFSTAENSTYFQIRTKDPSKQHWADMAIERAKQRYAESQASSGSKKVKVKVKEKPTTPPKPKENFAKAYGSLQDAEKIEQIMSNAPKEVKEVWDRYAENIKIAETDVKRPYFYPLDSSIHINTYQDRNGSMSFEPFQATLHESGHAIDFTLGKERLGKQFKYASFAEHWNNGEFSKTLVAETDKYIKNYQAELTQKRHHRVAIGDARSELGFSMFRWDIKERQCVSDIVEGATKGKFSGPSGHGKTYWTGGTRSAGNDVAVEAFAHMFEAHANPKEMAKIKEIYPKSYDCFLRMMKEVAES